MASLASTYQAQGRWREAEEIQEKVLQGYTKVFGPDHRNTLQSMSDLAFSREEQGWWKEAEELQVQVIEGRKRVLGVDHPATSAAMERLAWIYINHGKWGKAEESRIIYVEDMREMMVSLATKAQSTCRIVRLQKLPEDLDGSDDNRAAEPWERVKITAVEDSSQKNIKEIMKSVAETEMDDLQKRKAALHIHMQAQIDRATKKVKSEEQDDRFDWELAQFDVHLRYIAGVEGAKDPRDRKGRLARDDDERDHATDKTKTKNIWERHAIDLYYRRFPKPQQDILDLYNRVIRMHRMQSDTADAVPQARQQPPSQQLHQQQMPYRPQARTTFNSFETLSQGAATQPLSQPIAHQNHQAPPTATTSYNHCPRQLVHPQPQTPPFMPAIVISRSPSLVRYHRDGMGPTSGVPRNTWEYGRRRPSESWPPPVQRQPQQQSRYEDRQQSGGSDSW